MTEVYALSREDVDFLKQAITNLRNQSVNPLILPSTPYQQDQATSTYLVLTSASGIPAITSPSGALVGSLGTPGYAQCQVVQQNSTLVPPQLALVNGFFLPIWNYAQNAIAPNTVIAVIQNAFGEFVPVGSQAGIQGIPGTDGIDGEDGMSIPGPQGYPGVQGIPGIPGWDGIDGEDGFGLPGPQGVRGADGFTVPGLDGDDGEDGMTIPGTPGTAGPAGTPGVSGIPGLDGDDGENYPIIPYILSGIQSIEGTANQINAVTSKSSTTLSLPQQLFMTEDALGTTLSISPAAQTTANTAGNPMTFGGAAGNGSGAGGAGTFFGGTGGATGNGGPGDFFGGTGGATSGNGGPANLFGGSAQGGNSNGGNVVIKGGAKHGSGTNGLIELQDVASGFMCILDTTAITASRTYTFPDATGNLSLGTVATGGTGNMAGVAYSIICGGTTSTGAFQNIAIGTAGRLLVDQGASALAAFKAMSGDATLASTGAITVAANAITYAKFQQVAAVSLVGNPTGSLANAEGITVAAPLGFNGTELAITGPTLLLAQMATNGSLPAVNYNNTAGTLTATSTGTAFNTINGVTAAAIGTTVLVLSQGVSSGSAFQNGFYTFTTMGASGVAAVLTRSTAMNIAGQFPGALVYQLAGTVGAGSLYQCTNTAIPTIGTTSITFSKSINSFLTQLKVVAPGSSTAGSVAVQGGFEGDVPFIAQNSASQDVLCFDNNFNYNSGSGFGNLQVPSIQPTGDGTACYYLDTGTPFVDGDSGVYITYVLYDGSNSPGSTGYVLKATGGTTATNVSWEQTVENGNVTGAITSQTLATWVSPQAGTYTVGGMIDITALVTGTLSLQVTFNDDAGNSKTLTVPLTSLAGTVAPTAGATGDFCALVATIQTDGSASIVIEVTTGIGFSGTYNAYGFIEIKA